jgi:hypothetical protein
VGAAAAALVGLVSAARERLGVVVSRVATRVGAVER